MTVSTSRAARLLSTRRSFAEGHALWARKGARSKPARASLLRLFLRGSNRRDRQACRRDVRNRFAFADDMRRRQHAVNRLAHLPLAETIIVSPLGEIEVDMVLVIA